MTRFLTVYRWSVRALLHGKRVWALLGLALLPALIMLLGGGRTSTLFSFFHEGPFATFFLVTLPVVALDLASAALGNERRRDTLSFLLVRPMRREVIVAAKWLAAWTATMAILGVGVLVLVAGYLIHGGDTQPLLPMMIGTSASTGAYVSLFLALGFITQRAMLIGLAYVFIWESAITFAVAGLATVSLFRIGISAYAALLPESQRLLAEPLGSLTPGAWGAIAKTAVLAALAVLAMAAVLRRRDVT